MTIASDEFYERLRQTSIGMAMCWTLKLEDGSQLHFTNHDRKLTYTVVDGSEATFLPTSTFSGTAVTGREGLSVDNINITALTSEAITEEDLLAGVYDNAELIVYVAQWDAPEVGLLILKRGFLGEVTTRGGSFETEIRGLSEALQRTQGRSYNLECGAHFGDTRCGVDLSLYTFDASVLGAKDGRAFKIDLTKEATYFQYGTCEFVTGNNAGRKVEVLGHYISQGENWIVLFEKLPFQIDAGDELLLVRGCPKTVDFCKDIGNFTRFRGFPHMPTEEEAMATPSFKAG